MSPKFQKERVLEDCLKIVGKNPFAHCQILKLILFNFAENANSFSTILILQLLIFKHISN